MTVPADVELAAKIAYWVCVGVYQFLNSSAPYTKPMAFPNPVSHPCGVRMPYPALVMGLAHTVLPTVLTAAVHLSTIDNCIACGQFVLENCQEHGRARPMTRVGYGTRTPQGWLTGLGNGSVYDALEWRRQHRPDRLFWQQV